MKILITGGAGFIGSHLTDYLIKQGNEVIVADNFFSGKKENIRHHLNNPNFRLIKCDISLPFKYNFEYLDRIYNLACPASPVQYQFDPIKTLNTSVSGVQQMLELARKTGARFLQASTSEIYGDPLEHPQKETYWGNVDPLGERSCYDEGKRAAETLVKDYAKQYSVDARIIRIFNVYGPKMMFNDGRVISNFILQALLNENITVHGDGSQTRSFCYIDDFIEAIAGWMEHKTDYFPVNIGNPEEYPILDLAEKIKSLTGSSSSIVKIHYDDVPGRQGDVKQRRADIGKISSELNWKPRVSLTEGLQKTICDFKHRLKYKPRIAVFAPTYLPFKGPAEEAVEEIINRSLAWEFDIFTAKLDNKLENEEHIGNVHIYRLGHGRKSDKFLLPFKAAFFAGKLHKKNNYQIAWAVMASYGALAACLFSFFHSATSLLLSVFEGDITDKMIKKGIIISPLYRIIFKSAHRWQLIAAMNERQMAWLEQGKKVQAVKFDKNWDLLAKKTKDLFNELEILSTRL